jgi:hypothetical protein
MNRRAKRRVIVLCALVALLLIVSIVCYLAATATSHETKIIAERRDAKGEIRQRIICEVTTTKTIPLPGPHGWQRVHHSTYKYFLEVPEKGVVELPFLFNVVRPYVHKEEWRPIPDSNLWVAPGFTEKRRFEVFVFDGTHLIHQRELNAISYGSRSLGIISDSFALRSQPFALVGHVVFSFMTAGLSFADESCFVPDAS